MKRPFPVLLFVFALLVIISCTKDKTSEPVTPDPSHPDASDIQNTIGFGILEKAVGIWNGPVTSTTPLGGYPEWIVDFRPISENQVSAKNELDTLNDIHMSFFVIAYNNEYRVCFRNGGSFGGQKRVSYFMADSVSENATKSFYRFTEIKNGKSRAYTDITFRNDSLIMQTYTNHYNTQATATPHMTWSAKLQDRTSAEAAVSHFGFPKKSMTKNFSSTFTLLTEAIFYTLNGDPYPESDQPYLGQTHVTYSYASGYTPDASKKVLLMLTTQPLISGFSFNTGNLKYRSRYVLLNAEDLDFTFNYMHPGTYYLYAFYDNDGNGTFNSGDWVSASNTSFSLDNQQQKDISVQINFTIP